MLIGCFRYLTMFQERFDHLKQMLEPLISKQYKFQRINYSWGKINSDAAILGIKRIATVTFT